MANNYCRLLSNSFRFLGEDSVRYQPCCWVPLSPPVSSIEQLTLYRQDITRRVLADKEKYCHVCINREKSGYNDSHRQISFKQIPEEAQEGEVVELSIQIDNTCNAACAICNAGFSSLWAKEMNPSYKLENTEYKFVNLVNMLDLSHLKTVRFFGGEPLVNDNHLIILNAIKNPENVSLFYSTNGSIFPNDKTLDIWSKFKRVDVMFSIDGIDDRFHYIRWPLSWNKVKTNIENFSSIPAVSKISFNYTVNALNAWYFNELDDWVNNLDNSSKKYLPITVSGCYGIWATDAMPAVLQQKVIEKYGADHKITKLVKTFTPSANKWDSLVKELNRLDAVRSLSHHETFKEVLEIINQ